MLKVTPSTGQQLQQIVATNLKADPKIVAKARNVLFGKAK
jgi:hypothetical protein